MCWKVSKYGKQKKSKAKLSNENCRKKKSESNGNYKRQKKEINTEKKTDRQTERKKQRNQRKRQKKMKKKDTGHGQFDSDREINEMKQQEPKNRQKARAVDKQTGRQADRQTATERKKGERQTEPEKQTQSETERRQSVRLDKQSCSLGSRRKFFDRVITGCSYDQWYTNTDTEEKDLARELLVCLVATPARGIFDRFSPDTPQFSSISSG